MNNKITDSQAEQLLAMFEDITKLEQHWSAHIREDGHIVITDCDAADFEVDTQGRFVIVWGREDHHMMLKGDGFDEDDEEYKQSMRQYDRIEHLARQARIAVLGE